MFLEDYISTIDSEGVLGFIGRKPALASEVKQLEALLADEEDSSSLQGKEVLARWVGQGLWTCLVVDMHVVASARRSCL